MRSKKPFLPHMGIPPMKPLPALRTNGSEVEKRRTPKKRRWVSAQWKKLEWPARNTEALVGNAPGRSPRLRRIRTSCPLMTIKRAIRFVKFFARVIADLI